MPMPLRTLCVVALLLLASACMSVQPASTAPAPAAFPGASWETLPPAGRGTACRRDLDATHDDLRTLDTTALMAVQDGRVLLAHGPVEAVSIVFSVRKSVLAMLYGKYVANGTNGTIGLDRTLADLGIDDTGGLLPIERQATVRDLLTARHLNEKGLQRNQCAGILLFN
ncbi:hypothetical protein [Acidovorax sp. SUPP3334]|uniref:hypothetical protein n=1 Tax=Acidovorax sp. SUPP3334 TaxID=2920881 RepID=UPI0023DE5705|nr:hypothetical protein [Acidovorax sp. SUPP3334]GKT24968.1 hypothetical protein AVHM3334_16430 [Acidovorax sp. SUPP3334]